MTTRSVAILALLAGFGCASHPAGESSGGADGGSSTTASAVSVAAAFDARIAGLWVGSATQTVLGNFPYLNFDLRPADGHVMFGRVDLDPENSLRFAFDIETVNGQDTLVYRNGGYFKGILRDTRTALVDHDDAAGVYHFCAESGGCSYLDARFTFADPTHLTLDVHVRGSPHLLWQAVRKETRELPSQYPADSQSQGNGTAPFPTMPTLKASVTWSTPLTADADVWVFLSTSACISVQSCNLSRSMSVMAPAGSTSATVSIEQLHSGNYNIMAVLDRSRTLASTMAPTPGDSISNPFATFAIAATGTTTLQLPIIRDL